MNKKGAIHVDWAVSMGLFLVFVIGIFILLKPGAFPAYRGSTLTGLVEDYLIEETRIEVERVPVSFFTPSGEVSKIRIKFDQWRLFPFCDISESNYHLIYPPGSISSYYLNIDTSESDGVLCDSDGRWADNARVNVVISGVSFGSNTIEIIHGEDISQASGSGCGAEGAGCVDADLDSIVVGVREVESGISESALVSVLELLDESYDSIKDAIHFPVSKNFRVCRDVIGESSCHPNIDLPLEGDVFARLISEVIIDDKGVIIDRVDLIIQAW